MPDDIKTAIFTMRVPTASALTKRHQQALIKQRQAGIDVAESIVDDVVQARIEHNRWILDCYCGSGVAVHPDWSEARCFGIGCGRVYVNVEIPEDRADIEAALIARPVEATRNWNPVVGETAKVLRAENLVSRNLTPAEVEALQ